MPYNEKPDFGRPGPGPGKKRKIGTHGCPAMHHGLSDLTNINQCPIEYRSGCRKHCGINLTVEEMDAIIADPFSQVAIQSLTEDFD